MTRVVSLYLPHWAIDRVRRAERRRAPTPRPEPGTTLDLAPLTAAVAEEQVLQCDAPKNTGWRPGARWARSDAAAPAEKPWSQSTRADVARQVEAMPAHQRPPMREMGRRSEAADHPFRAMPPDEGARPVPTMLPVRPDPEDVPNTRWRGFDGLDPNADDRAAAALARWNAMPSVRYPGEGPHPDKYARCGSNDAGARVPGVAPFFDTGRTLANTVARASNLQHAPRQPHTRNVREVCAPLITVHKVGSRIEIAAASPEARALGLTPGMALTQARAAVPDIDVRDADAAGDLADLQRLATALARRWCPVVALSGSDGLFLEISGTAHLHGGEEAMARRLLRLLARLGITAQLAIADTAGAAWAFARQAAPAAIIPPGAHVAALEPLPVTALRLEDSARELLARLGVDTIGELMAMPRAPLVRRFGKSIAQRLDQATGALSEPIDPIIPVQPIAVTRRFAEPIATADAIGHWLAGLVDDLAGALAKAGVGARALAFVAARVDSTDQVIRIGLARASREPSHLLRLIVRRIEEIDVGYGLDALTLHLVRADPLGPETLGAALAEQQAPDLAPLVDTLVNRIGPARLWRHQPIESDVPERSVAPLPPLDPPTTAATRLKRDDVRQLDGRTPDHAWHPRWPRPARLLRRPEPIDHVIAEMPDHAPRRFTWRGRPHRITHSDGPERITGEWWRHAGERAGVRDYFRVEDDQGHRFWLFRRGDGVRAETGDLSWYIHGTFA
ncbi:DNA polymerase Y family protein [Sphingomonas sp. IC4-52]|uniref:DNA polymerase Y family protein n=1 Tax=Sphingomonas sp. IC4-52 TaxID=2887202 RepID=UPI001D106BF3|nr:DNA polymerase Y family protein [Sphingomonas sp. IC4-52]MCC2981642.1 DNA polymerase Y family protein [Sphingomonas sp. IC4-52]